MTDSLYVLGYDLNAPKFIHCVPLITNFGEGNGSHEPARERFSYEIYIGDNANYQDNPKCAGGPFMNGQDHDSYTVYGSTWQYKYGHEAWCNMEGRYVHIVADTSYLVS